MYASCSDCLDNSENALVTCGVIRSENLSKIVHFNQIFHSRRPLVCSEQLTGIVSWVIGCGEGGFPWVNTEVAYIRSG